MSDEHTKGGAGKGFAGLSSIVSNIDAIVADARANEQSSSGASQPSAMPTTSSGSASRSDVSSPPQTNGPSPWKALVVICAVLGGLVWLATGHDKDYSPPTSSSSYTPSLASSNAKSIPSSTGVQSSPTPPPAPRRQSSAAQSRPASARPSENKPPVGNGNVFSDAEIRYCVAEKIRMAAVQDMVDDYDEAAVDRFNAFVADYNSRCSHFRYRRGALESARSDIEPYRQALAAEGRARF